MQVEVPTDNPLVVNLHDYRMADAPVISIGDPDFPPFPITPSTTPSKPPAPKRLKPQRSGDLDSDGIVQRISVIFNTRIDSLEKSVEKMISNNTLKIEGLKKTVDFACAEIREVKGKVTHIDDRVNAAERKTSLLEQRITELENYSRRWNLRLLKTKTRTYAKRLFTSVSLSCRSSRPNSLMLLTQCTVLAN